MNPRHELGLRVAEKALAQLDRAADLAKPDDAVSALELAKQYRMLSDKLLPNVVEHQHPKSDEQPEKPGVRR